ncbi:MAG: M28 family peptidase, partial [Bacteroidales bacterium]|nr:M28 family peptidase [Bacteroidales bacterium]
MKFKHLIIITLALVSLNSCKPGYLSEITSEELQESINYLAGDELNGRFPGTPEYKILAEYIVNEMDISGLEIAADGGQQSFGISRGFVVTKNNKVFIGDQSLNIEQYKVFGFSATDTVSGRIMVGSDLPISEYKDLKDKILLLPFPSDLPESEYDAYGALRSLCLDAADAGAISVIFIHENQIPLYDHPQRNPLKIPVLAIQSSIIEEIISVQTSNLNELFKNIEGLLSENDVVVSIQSEVLAKEILSFNSVTHLSGSNPELADQYVIIGAHHDHLGMGGRGTSSRRQDTVAIHYGADDNASGVAGVMEIAQNMLSRSPERSFVFTTFGGEELGLLGSNYYSENPSIDLSSAQVMINLDMIGRLYEDRQLHIGGIG